MPQSLFTYIRVLYDVCKSGFVKLMNTLSKPSSTSWSPSKLLAARAACGDPSAQGRLIARRIVTSNAPANQNSSSKLGFMGMFKYRKSFPHKSKFAAFRCGGQDREVLSKIIPFLPSPLPPTVKSGIMVVKTQFFQKNL